MKEKIISACNMSNGGPMDMDQFGLEETVKLINGAGMVLKCTTMTKVKALLIYHHFKACVGETEYDPYTVAASCISLSVKCNEENIQLEKIIFTFYNMIDQSKKQSTLSKNFKDTLKTVNKVQMLILRMLEFDLNHAIAHQYLPYFMNDIQEELLISNVWDVFAEGCMRLASDFYLSNKCMIYKADAIAIAVIHVSLYMIGIDCSYFKLRLKILNNCSESKVQSIIEDIFTICFLGSRVESGKMELQ